MRIEVGKKYLTRAGNVVEITETRDHYRYKFVGDNGATYTANGERFDENDPDPYDIVAEYTGTDGEITPSIGGPAVPCNPGAQVVGRKDDSGKLDLTLLVDDLPHALQGVCEVLQWAITKKQPEPYERGSWQGVEDFQRRYRAAMLRHIFNAATNAKASGGTFEDAQDWETELLELQHIATDALFMLEMALRKQKGIA